MPKAKSKSASRRVASDDESSSGNESSTVPSTQPNATQSSSTAVNRAFSQLSVQDRELAINNIVRYLLIADQRKLPIKRADIVKSAGLSKENSRAFVSLMSHAAEKLRSVFGIELVEVESSKQKAYILINALDNNYDQPHQIWPEEDNARIGLVMVVLSVIFMRGNIISEDDLFDMLRRLGVSVDRPDETFGDVRRLLTQEFVRMGYLDMEREQGDPPMLMFRWGPRAKAETNKRNALDFVGQVFSVVPQERWIAQMQDIEQSEQSDGNDDGNGRAAAPAVSEKSR